MAPIEGYPGYFTSEEGVVWSNRRGLQKLKQRIDVNGYWIVNLYCEGKRSTKRVHCLIAKGHVSGWSAGLEVNHKDGNKANNSAANLEWVTHSENCKHAFANGLRDAALPRPGKLTYDDVLAIRECPSTTTHQDLATQYGVHKRTIARIRTQASWTRV